MGLLDSLIVSLGFKVSAEPLEKANRLLEGVNHRLELIAGLEIAKSLFETVERFAGLGEALEQASFQAGITAEEFQKLVYAGTQFGASQDQIQMGLARMSRLLQQARDGSKGAIAQFQKLGISKEQIAGFSNAEEAFFGVQDALAGIPDQFRRVAATQAIFGRGAVGLVKFASAGSKASRQLGNEAERMGAVIGTEGVEGLAKFEMSMKAIGLTVRGFFGTIAGAFAPAITAAVKDVQQLIAANRELLADNVTVWSERIVFALGATVEMFRIAAQAVSQFIAEHPRLIAFVTKTAAVLVSMSLAGSTLKFVFSGLASVLRVVAAAISLIGGRVTLALAGVTLLILGLKALWDMAHGKSFADTAFGKSLQWLKDYASEAGGALKEALGISGSVSTPSLQEGTHKNVPTYVQNRLQHGLMTMGSFVNPGETKDPDLLPIPNGSTHNVNVNVPITMSVNSATGMGSLKKQMEQIADEVFTQAAQRTYRDHLPAASR